MEFKQYYLNLSTNENSDFLKIYLIAYNNVNLSKIHEYSYKDSIQIFDDLSNMKVSQTPKHLEIDAINSITNIKFRSDASKFVFHFCNKYDSKNDEYYKKSEVSLDLREICFTYELFFFNSLKNNEFYQKLEEIGIEADVNNLDI